MAKEGLRKWFSRNQGKGWVDCKTGKPCGRRKGEKRKSYFSRNQGKGWVDCKTGKPCGRRKGEKRKSYPACRPTMAQCTSAMKKKTSSKRISWK